MQLHEIFRIEEQHHPLLALLQWSHYQAALKNDNTSSAAAVAVFRASGDIGKAIAAATLTQGGLHAPIEMARIMFESPHMVDTRLAQGQKVPGFGNSFYKDKIDPSFSDLYETLSAEMKQRIGEINYRPKLRKLRPNAAIITAAACVQAGIPAGVGPMIFAYCRIPAWTRLCMGARVAR